MFRCLLTPVYKIKKFNTIQKPTNNLGNLKIQLTSFRINQEYLRFESKEFSFGFKHLNSLKNLKQFLPLT